MVVIHYEEVLYQVYIIYLDVLCLCVCDCSVQSLLSKPDSWKSTRSLDDDDEDDEAWFDEEEDELLPGAGESLATAPCIISSRLSPDCDQINQYLDKGSLLLFLCFSVCEVYSSLKGYLFEISMFLSG